MSDDERDAGFSESHREGRPQRDADRGVAPAADTGRESSGDSRGDGSEVPRRRAPDPGEFRFGAERCDINFKIKRSTCIDSRCRALEPPLGVAGKTSLADYAVGDRRGPPGRHSSEARTKRCQKIIE